MPHYEALTLARKRLLFVDPGHHTFVVDVLPRATPHHRRCPFRSYVVHQNQGHARNGNVRALFVDCAASPFPQEKYPLFSGSILDRRGPAISVGVHCRFTRCDRLLPTDQCSPNSHKDLFAVREDLVPGALEHRLHLQQRRKCRKILTSFETLRISNADPH